MTQLRHAGILPGPGRELPRMSEVGRTIYRIVKERPGIHFRGLGRAAQLSSAGQLRHHLDRLERQGLLVELEDGRYKRFFVAGDHDRSLRPGLARFARAVPRKIGKLLLVHPMNRTELRRSLGCADSTLGYHLKRMLEQGDLEKQRGRNCCKYSLTRPDLVAKVLMLQGAGLEEPASELPPLGMTAPVRAVPRFAPEPERPEPPAPERPEPSKPEPFEPVQVPEMGVPAPAVVPQYLVPAEPEELLGTSAPVEAPSVAPEPDPTPEPGSPEPDAPGPADPIPPDPALAGVQKVQEP